MPEPSPQSSGRPLHRASRLAAVALLALLLPAAPLLAQDDTPEGWPREIETDVATVILYQPQIDSFEGDKLTARAAVAARAKDAKEQDFGAVWIEARIQTDRDDR
ncbi:MAG: hypothetical protein GWO04_29150, partial [Actinobacteria bacterium]|nr:hypothetical protein [Actinomycetota bacterium]